MIINMLMDSLLSGAIQLTTTVTLLLNLQLEELSEDEVISIKRNIAGLRIEPDRENHEQSSKYLAARNKKPSQRIC